MLSWIPRVIRTSFSGNPAILHACIGRNRRMFRAKLCRSDRFHVRYLFSFAVAPYAGAWIEIIKNVVDYMEQIVAPYAGAWIEIGTHQNLSDTDYTVAPYAGAWIEINSQSSNSGIGCSRPLCGGVD